MQFALHRLLPLVRTTGKYWEGNKSSLLWE
jgi:hypothetical protein